MSDDSFIPYARNLSLESISRMVRARREWWAKRKALSAAGAPVTRALKARPHPVTKTPQPNC